jgi:hypothetical protein
MGAAIEIWDLKMTNPMSAYFGGAAIGYGSFAIVVDYLKAKRKAKPKKIKVKEIEEVKLEEQTPINIPEEPKEGKYRRSN